MARPRRFLWLILVAALLAGGLSVAVSLGKLSWPRLASALLRPLINLSLAIAVGLLVGMVIESAGLTGRLGRLASPLLRLGRLKDASAMAFTTAFFSAIAASTILMNAYRDGGISRRELTLSALLLTFPAFFAHLPTMFFVITPLVGRLGVYYLLILLSADLLRTAAYLLYGRSPSPLLHRTAFRARPAPVLAPGLARHLG